jgi:dihydroorotate dehydrogenase (fumarate)
MDLTTNYLGLRLRNPLVASAGPLTGTVAGVRSLAAAGVGAVVLPSLFEEDIRRQAERDALLDEAGTHSFAEALTYRPTDDTQSGPHAYLNLIERTADVGVPVIASLNGATEGGWTDYAVQMQQAGAAAIELNIHDVPRAPFTSGRDLEQRQIDVLTAVKNAVTIPVAVKMSPYFSSPGEMARRFSHAGADGLVLFNRFVQTGIDPETLTMRAGLQLSHPAEAAYPRSWIAKLHGHVESSLAASTGVDDADDVAAYLLAGADVVMTASALLRHGPDYAATLLDDLTAWTRRKGFRNLNQLRGMLASPAGIVESPYGRAGYISALKQGTREFGPR